MYWLYTTLVLVLHSQAIISEKVWECGRTGRGTKTVSGKKMGNREFPWMVQLKISGIVCGATLISRKMVLTAGHCFDRTKDLSRISAWMERHFLDSGGTAYSFEKIIMHPKYNAAMLKDDLAIGVLARAVNYSPNLSPVCLSTLQPGGGKQGTAIGWGDTYYRSRRGSKTLQKVVLDIISLADCQAKFQGEKRYPRETNICTLTPGKDTCQGDSGGPLVMKEGGQYYQVGIVSWGKRCADGIHPGVWTSVASYLPWIRDQMENYPRDDEIPDQPAGDPGHASSGGYTHLPDYLAILLTLLLLVVGETPTYLTTWLSYWPC